MMLKKTNFNLIELMVVFAILSVIFSLLQPSLKSIQNNTEKLTCQNQLKQIGYATAQYNEDFDRWLPISHAVGGLDPAWPIELSSYLDLSFTNGRTMVARNTVIDCPSHNFKDYPLHPKYGGYAFNHNYLGWTNVPRLTASQPHLQRQRITEVTHPSATIYMSDGLDYDQNIITNDYMLKYIYISHPNYPNRIYDRHTGEFNVLWADFSVQQENWLQISLGRNNDPRYYFRKEK